MSLYLNENYDDAPTIQEGEVIADYVVGKSLGEGSYASVYAAKHLETNAKVALKLLYDVDEYRRDQIKTEVKMLQRLADVENVVSLLLYTRWNECKVLVLPRLGPSLEDLWKLTPDRRFIKETVLKIGIEVVSTLESIHGMGILHRSLKMPNLCFSNFRDLRTAIIFIDFGMGRDFDMRHGRAVPVKETMNPYYHLRPYSSYQSKCHRNRYTPRDDVVQVLYLLLKASGGTCAYEGKDDEETDENKRTLERQPEWAIPQQSMYLLKFCEQVHSQAWEEYPCYEHLRQALLDATDGAPISDEWNFQDSEDRIRRLI